MVLRSSQHSFTDIDAVISRVMGKTGIPRENHLFATRELAHLLKQESVWDSILVGESCYNVAVNDFFTYLRDVEGSSEKKIH